MDEFRRKQSQYDLGREFAKTSKNRSPIVPVVILGMSLLFLIGALALTFYIQEKGKQITVNIRDFEDINLKDVLDAAKRNEQEMERVRRESESLTWKMEEEIQSVQDGSLRELDIITADMISLTDKDRRTRAVHNREAARIEQIKAGYGPQIEEYRLQIGEIQKRIDQYDTRQLELAREREEILNNQQKLAAMELENTKRHYEELIASMIEKHAGEVEAMQKHEKEIVRLLRARHAREMEDLILLYNPVVREEAVVELLNRPADESSRTGTIPGAYREILARERIMGRSDYSLIETARAEHDTIFAELGKIPYRNSVPPMLCRIESRHRAMMKGYEYLWTSLADALVRKNESLSAHQERIARHLYAIEHLVKQSRENGYIIDARNRSLVTVYMDRVRPIAEGTEGLVFRMDDEYIGKVHLFLREGELYGSVIEQVSPDNPMQPFDKILIREKKEPGL